MRPLVTMNCFMSTWSGRGRERERGRGEVRDAAGGADRPRLHAWPAGGRTLPARTLAARSDRWSCMAITMSSRCPPDKICEGRGTGQGAGGGRRGREKDVRGHRASARGADPSPTWSTTNLPVSLDSGHQSRRTRSRPLSSFSYVTLPPPSSLIVTAAYWVVVVSGGRRREGTEGGQWR